MPDVEQATRDVVAELRRRGEEVIPRQDRRYARWRVLELGGVVVRLRFFGVRPAFEAAVEQDQARAFDAVKLADRVLAVAQERRAALVAEQQQDALIDQASALLDRLRLRGTPMTVDPGTTGLVLRLRAPATPAQVEAIAEAARACGLFGP